MPVGEMLRRMDSAELTEWMAYFELRNAHEKPKSLKDQFAALASRKKG